MLYKIIQILTFLLKYSLTTEDATDSTSAIQLIQINFIIFSF